MSETTHKISANELKEILKQNNTILISKNHTHANKSILDKFSVNESGVLLYDGEPIEGSEEVITDEEMAQAIAEDSGSISTMWQEFSTAVDTSATDEEVTEVFG